MKKIIVEVYVPILLKSYDVLLPPKMIISDACVLISNMVRDLNTGEYTVSNQEMLFDKFSGEMLTGSSTIEELNLSNGVCLILV